MPSTLLELTDATVERSVRGLSGSKKFRTTWANKFDLTLPQPGEPFDNEFPFLRLTAYSYERADIDGCIITCRYDSENQRDTTFVERTLDFGVECLDTTRGCKWDSLNAPVDVPVSVVYPTCELVIAVQMETTPLDSIFANVGKLNSSTFMDCPAETLLFEGANVREQYNQEGYLIGAQCSFKFLKRTRSHNEVWRAARQKMTDGIPQYYQTADSGKPNYTTTSSLDSSPVYVSGSAGQPGWDKPYWMDGATKRYLYESCDFEQTLGLTG